MALTKRDVDKAAPREERYLLADTDGLVLVVYPSGRKTWMVRLWRYGREARKTIGEYPAMTITEARRERNRVKLEFKGKNNLTLEEVTARWLAAHAREISPTTVQNYVRWIGYINALIGKRDVSGLTRRELVEALERIERKRSTMVARGVAMTLGQVFMYALNHGLIATSPAQGLSRALSARPPVAHMQAAFEPEQVGRVLRAIEFLRNTTYRLALRFIAYTFVRAGELRKAVWSEIDGNVWHIPAAHTKRRKPLDVPLARQCLAILDVQHQRTGGKALIFPTHKGTELDSGTLRHVLGSLQGLEPEWRPPDVTVHGFRSTASSILNESGLWHPDAIERQLSHSPEDTVRGIYNRAEYWDERVKMMQWYADKLDKLTQMR